MVEQRSIQEHTIINGKAERGASPRNGCSSTTSCWQDKAVRFQHACVHGQVLNTNLCQLAGCFLSSFPFCAAEVLQIKTRACRPCQTQGYSLASKISFCFYSMLLQASLQMLYDATSIYLLEKCGAHLKESSLVFPERLLPEHGPRVASMCFLTAGSKDGVRGSIAISLASTSTPASAAISRPHMQVAALMRSYIAGDSRVPKAASPHMLTRLALCQAESNCCNRRTWISLMSMPWTSVRSLVVMTTSESSALPERSRAAALSLYKLYVAHSTDIPSLGCSQLGV